MVVAGLGQPAQGEDDDEGGHGEADDDGGQHQRLRDGVAGLGDLADYRRFAGEAAHGEEEQVHRVGKQGQPQHHREGTRPQQQVHTAGGEHAEGDGEQRLHQFTSLASAASSGGAVSSPSPERISRVAPTTVRYTPRSNSIAVASSISPTSGKWKWPNDEVRNG
ncbi:hypothetical protein D3C78_1286740 [compost metagenome]